jgi:hypothetical protein
MGLQFGTDELKAIGVSLKTAYVNKYNVGPNKHEQQVSGGKITVNTYTSRDIDLMRTAISDFDRKKRAQPRISFAVAAGPAAGPT